MTRSKEETPPRLPINLPSDYFPCYLYLAKTYANHQKKLQGYFLPPLTPEAFQQVLRKGNLQQKIKSCHAKDLNAVLQSALKIFILIGNLLDGLSASGVPLSRITLDNFVIYQGKIYLAKTDLSDEKAEPVRNLFLHFKEMKIESLMDEELSKQFAECLYQFLTGQPKFDFSFKHPIFQTRQGKLLQKLIVELKSTNQTVSLKETVERLRMIADKLIELKEPCYELLKNIQPFVSYRNNAKEFMMNLYQKVNLARLPTIMEVYEELEKVAEQEESLFHTQKETLPKKVTQIQRNQTLLHSFFPVSSESNRKNCKNRLQTSTETVPQAPYPKVRRLNLKMTDCYPSAGITHLKRKIPLGEEEKENHEKEICTRGI